MVTQAKPPPACEIKPGIYFDIPIDDYHAGPGVSKSQLDLLAKEPALLEWSKNAPRDEEERASVDIGQAVHSLLLQPDTFTDLFVVDFTAPKGAIVTAEDARAALDGRGIPYATKDAKPTLIAKLLDADPEAPVLDSLKEQWAAGAAGKIVLTAAEHRKVILMRDSVMAHPFARSLIEAPGPVESSIYWIDPETGELCRCRPDKRAELGNMSPTVDVKTTDDVDRFYYSVEDYRYEVQDAFYTDGVAAQFGTREPFIFLAVSNRREAGRYPVRCWVLPEWQRIQGRDTMRRDINLYHRCRTTGKWPGIGVCERPAPRRAA